MLGIDSLKKLELDKTKNNRIKVACIECRRQTVHLVLVSADESGEDDEIQWKSIYQIIQCQGCETISFRHETSNSEDFVQTGEDDWDPEITELLYPSRTEGRKYLNDYQLLPFTVQNIYKETFGALNNKLSILTGIGIRALIETVSIEKNASGKDLFNKINDLVLLGVLTKEGAEILHKLRILGNKAAHEIKPHSEKQLMLALDVVENLLQGVYILPHHAKKTFI